MKTTSDGFWGWLEFWLALLFIAFVLFAMTSCKSTRTTTDETGKTETSVQNDVKTGASLNAVATSNEQSTDQSEAVESVHKESIITKWSPPDSTGRQYPTETRQESETRATGRKNNIENNKQQSAGLVANADTNDKSKLKGREKGKQATTVESEDETHTWAVYGIIAGVIGAVLLGYLILRRLGLA